MDILNRYFVSYHEKIFLTVLLTDGLLKTVGFPWSAFVSKITLYFLLVLILASFMRFNSRNHVVIAFVMYLPTYLLSLVFDFEGATLYFSLAVYAAVVALFVVMGKVRKVAPSGPYGVGFRQFVIKKETTPTVSVFYPIRREEYDRLKSNHDGIVQWWTSETAGIDASSVWYKPYSPVLLYELMAYKIEAIPNKELHPDFATGGKKLTPVIYCHGLSSIRHKSSSIVNNLVSYGCIVYCLDFTDGTCAAYQDHTTVPPTLVVYSDYDKDKSDISAEKFRRNQIDHRMKDIGFLLQHIKEEAKSDTFYKLFL